MTPDNGNGLILYSFWRSSAAYRVRIALNLKGLSYETVAIDLIGQDGEQLSPQYRKINPQGLVPALSDDGWVITQSMAICEYLDENYGGHMLLPDEPLRRARVRSLALQVACDIHPLNNLRVQKYLAEQCDGTIDTTQWMHHWMSEGFAAIEQQLTQFCAEGEDVLGEIPGLFECFLIPQVYNAERFGMDIKLFPQIGKIVTECRQLDTFVHAAPENQADAAAV